MPMRLRLTLQTRTPIANTTFSSRSLFGRKCEFMKISFRTFNIMHGWLVASDIRWPSTRDADYEPFRENEEDVVNIYKDVQVWVLGDKSIAGT